MVRRNHFDYSRVSSKCLHHAVFGPNCPANSVVLYSVANYRPCLNYDVFRKRTMISSSFRSRHPNWGQRKHFDESDPPSAVLHILLVVRAGFLSHELRAALLAISWSLGKKPHLRRNAKRIGYDGFTVNWPSTYHGSDKHRS